MAHIPKGLHGALDHDNARLGLLGVLGVCLVLVHVPYNLVQGVEVVNPERGGENGLLVVDACHLLVRVLRCNAHQFAHKARTLMDQRQRARAHGGERGAFADAEHADRGDAIPYRARR